MEADQILESVRERFGRIAREGTAVRGRTNQIAGYTEEQVKQAPEAADMSLGCGNPVALAAMKEGDVVLDLGSGAGFDAFLAATRVGSTGRVIGVDMTDEMITRARENAKKGGIDNVEFRLGKIESLPVDNASADIIISNCVINLSVDKKQVFREAYRALKPGGRLMVSDMVLLRELPTALRESASAYAACVAGALLKEDYLRAISEAGFRNIQVLGESSFSMEMVRASLDSDPTLADAIAQTAASETDLEVAVNSVVSMKVSAIKE